MAKIYTNENFPMPAVNALRALGHHVLTTLDAGKSDQKIPDDDVLAFATAEQRILVTLNRRDFINLHKKDPNHQGIIACTFDTDFNALAERIHAVIEAQPDMAGQLIRINRPNP